MTTTTASFSIPALNTKTFRIAFIALFVSASSYAYGILTAPKTYSSAITIGFLSVLVAVFSYNLLKILRADARDLSGELPVVVLYALALHLALILGFYLSGRIEHALWVADSYAVHIPGAVNVANYIHGKEALTSIGVPFGRVFFTQAFVGVFFSFMGASPISSAIALMLAKLLTLVVLFHLGKTMFNEKVGLIGALVYVLSPTIIYYTTVFYKEAIVQLLVSAISLSALKIYLKPGSWRYWLILIVSMSAVANERFYLFFFFVATVILLGLVMARMSRKIYLAAAVVLLVFGAYALIGKYVDLMAGGHIPYRDILPSLFSAIKGYRADYISYPDVTSINFSLPYPLAFVKLLFTPFFTLNKFTLFSDYSYLLIWGSFLNQIVIAFSLYGMYKALRDNWQRNLSLIFPYLLFLCIFAYVAPYIGRLRDSFYPVVAIYAAYAISEVYAMAPVLKSGSQWKKSE